MNKQMLKGLGKVAVTVGLSVVVGFGGGVLYSKNDKTTQILKAKEHKNLQVMISEYEKAYARLKQMENKEFKEITEDKVVDNFGNEKIVTTYTDGSIAVRFPKENKFSFLPNGMGVWDYRVSTEQELNDLIQTYKENYER